MPNNNTDSKDLRFAKRTRAGTALALIAGISMTSIELFKRVEFLQVRLAYAALIMAALGIILSICKLGTYGKRTAPEEVLLFYRNPHFHGLVLLISATIFYTFCPAAKPPPPPVVAVAPEPAPAPVPEPPPAEPDRPEFPELQVTAVVLNGERSQATVNGKVVWVGEDIGNVRLVRVTEAGIVVELAGIQQEYSFGKGAKQPAPNGPTLALGKNEQK
jgi:hypothetical protein